MRKRPTYKRTLLLSISLFSCLCIKAQSSILGYIHDQSNNVTLEGAYIFTETDTTVTDSKGRFEVEVSTFPVEVRVSYQGYRPLSMVVQEGSKTPISIRLSTEAIALNQVVVTSGISRDKIINTASSVSLVDQTQMCRDAPFSISNSLNRVSGIYMHAGTLNTNRITIRGMGSRSPFSTDKIKAYYDQIPLTDGSGNSSLEDVDQSLIERIEIIKGPNSSLYGAGLGGVIQLRSVQPDYDKTSFESSLTAGSYGRRRILGKVSHSSEKLSLNLAYTDIKSDGYRDNNQYQKKQVGLTGRYYFKNDSYLNFIGIFTDLFSEIPSSLNEEDYKNSPRSAAANWSEAQGYEDYKRNLIGIGFHHSPTKSIALSHSISLQTKDTYEPAPGPFVNVMDEELSGFSTRHTFQLENPIWNLNAGVEWFHDTRDYIEYQNLHTPTSNGSVQGPENDRFNEKRAYTNVFSEFAYRPNNRVKLVAGLNLNHTRYELEDKFNETADSRTGSYSFNTVLSPRIGSVVHLTSNTHLFTNISHGFSPPNLEETLYPGGQINPNIRPEKGWNFESGLRGKILGIAYDATAYFMNISNLLVSRTTLDNEQIGVNAGKNHHWGADASLEYSLTFRESTHLRFYHNTSIMRFRFKEFLDEGEDYSGNKLTGVPTVHMTSGIELMSKQGFYGNVNSQYTGSIPITDDNELIAKDYFILRGKAGFKKDIKMFSLDLSAGIDNISNKKYASMLLINSGPRRYYYPGLPRNYFSTLSIGYNFR
ncbi:MAG: TonB-dependent receptor [Cyclobacteriaceae bacterium]